MALHLDQPHRIQSLRLAVGHAGGQVPVADHDGAGAALTLDLALPLVPIGDVEQLHDLGRVVAAAAERALDLLADGRLAVGECQQSDVTARSGEAVAQQLGLRLLAALIETFESDEQSVRHVSSASTSSMVWRRRMTVHCVSSTRTSGARKRRL